jgi:hypothetical protein
LIKISDIYEHVLKRYENEQNQKTFKKILREIQSDHFQNYINKNNRIEEIYSEKIIEILVMFLSDKKVFLIKSQNKSMSLKACLGEFVNNGHEIYLLNDFINIFNNHQKDYSAFHKNFIFNIVKIHLKNVFKCKSFDEYSIEPW